MGLTSPVDVNPSAANSDKERDTVNVAVNVTGTGSTTHTLSITLSGGTRLPVRFWLLRQWHGDC